MIENWFDTPIGRLYGRYELKDKMVLFLSGAGTFPSFENYQAIFSQFPEQIGYLSLDLPNAGRSEIKDQKGVQLDDVAEAVRGILRELGISRYLLVAHSLAGLIALKLSQDSTTCLGLVTVEPTTYASIFGNLAEHPYPEWQDLQEAVMSAGSVESYLQQEAEKYLPTSISTPLLEISQKMSQDLLEQKFQYSWEMTPTVFKDLNIADHIPHRIFCQAYREQEYLQSEYWNAATELVLGGSQHYLQWSQADEIRAALLELADQD